MTDPLPLLLATLLPGDGDYPSGAGAAAQLRQDMAAPDAAAALGEVLAALSPGFAAGDEAALRRIEAALPQAFDRVVTAAYIAYYTDPEVRLVIERLTGYAARPPQPQGYELPPFDESLLEVQKRRAPFWRDPEQSA
jgi:hypothetical protein